MAKAIFSLFQTFELFGAHNLHKNHKMRSHPEIRNNIENLTFTPDFVGSNLWS